MRPSDETFWNHDYGSSLCLTEPGSGAEGSPTEHYAAAWFSVCITSSTVPWNVRQPAKTHEVAKSRKAQRWVTQMTGTQWLLKWHRRHTDRDVEADQYIIHHGRDKYQMLRRKYRRCLERYLQYSRPRRVWSRMNTSRFAMGGWAAHITIEMLGIRAKNNFNVQGGSSGERFRHAKGRQTQLLEASQVPMSNSNLTEVWSLTNSASHASHWHTPLPGLLCNIELSLWVQRSLTLIEDEILTQS